MPKLVGEHWKERVLSIKGETPNWGAGRIASELQKEAARDDRMDAPSERWVGNILRNCWNKMTEEERRQYSLFSWPQSMEASLLPWEASAASLELLEVRRKVDPFIRFLEQKDHELDSIGIRWGRPSIRLAKCFWHITQAAPDLPAVSGPLEFSPYIDIPGRYDIAVVLADTTAQQRLLNAIETYLSYAPWRSSERALEYKVKVDLGEIPGLTQLDLIDYERARNPVREDLINEIFVKEEESNGEAQG